ncbi:MAG: hydroxymethylglutaryl-CoA reductase, degradative [Byssovorax sp.]
MSPTSVLPHFRKLGVKERQSLLAAVVALDEREIQEAVEQGGIDLDTANHMVENAIGTLGLPFGVALNHQVNGKDYLVPMAVEEPSVIAAASHAAKRIRATGGFHATVDESLMVTQIEVHDVADGLAAARRIRSAEAELLAVANEAVPNLVSRGGGARGIEVRDLGEGFVVTHVIVDCRDAMGANMLNTIAEALGPSIEALAGGRLGLRILSNFCDRRVARVTAEVAVEHFGCRNATGLEAARGVASASRFAELDPYRAVTHNKGIMNGVDAVVLATGNDWRAVEAAAHAYAAREGRYAPLATWKLSEDERTLRGAIAIPLALGTVGAPSALRTAARASRSSSSGCNRRGELAMVTAAAGLATNLAALRALSTEGIQRGHMALHHRASTSVR